MRVKKTFFFIAMPFLVGGVQACAQTGAGKPSAFVNGRIYDNHFEVNKAFYDGSSLTLRSKSKPNSNPLSPELYDAIKISFAQPERFEGKSYKVEVGQDKLIDGTEFKTLPHLDLYAVEGKKSDQYEDTVNNHSPYRMTLQFYKIQNGLLPGYIDLEISSKRITHIKGFFYAAPR